MATPTPVSSVANPADGTIHVTYSDNSVQTLPAAQAQKLKLLPTDLKPAATATGFGSAGGYGGAPSGAFSATTGTGTNIYDPNTGTSLNASGAIPLKVGSKVVPTAIGDLVSQSRLPVNLAQIRKNLVSHALIAKTEKNPTRIQNAWIQVLLGAQQSQMDPNDYLSSLSAAGFGQNAPTTTSRVTDYSKTADGYFYQAFQKVFNRMPTVIDMQSPFKDSKGKTITWQQAMINEAKKPNNQEVTTTAVNPDGTVSSQVSTPGFDPNVWLQKQLTDYYAKAVASGAQQAEQPNIDKYIQLAGEYGVPVIDPTTKELNVNARLDLSKIEAGTKKIEDVEQSFKNAALGQYGHLQTQLVNANQTLKQVAQPAIDKVAALLEKDPNSVTVNDPYVQKYLKGDGKTVMDPASFEATIKQDPSWQYTQNARATYSDLASSILQRFGVNA
jgi:hypothetical protein